YLRCMAHLQGIPEKIFQMILFRTMKLGKVIIPAFLLLSVLASCKSYQEQEEELPDSRNGGTINVSADETFKPIIDEQVQIYESNHPGARMVVDYKAEAECL